MALLLAVHRPWRRTSPPTLTRSLSGRRSVGSARGHVRASARGAASESNMNAADERYRKLQATQVVQVSTQQKLSPTSLWKDGDTTFCVWGRELATELAREVLPQLQGTGTKLLLFSIGTPERGREFAAKTGFPEELLMADPYSETYAAMGWINSFWKTFFSVKTPLSLLDRLQSKGFGVLKEVLSDWQPWIPPQSRQAYQQGGCLQFEGQHVAWSYTDQATAAHVKPEQILERAGVEQAA